MNKKTILFLLVVLFSTLGIKAQSGDRDFDSRFGLGLFNMKTDNAFILMSEYELNFKFTDYLAFGPSAVLGYHNKTSHVDLPNFYQLNLNAFVSPFGNNSKNEFRIGAGVNGYMIDEWSNYETRRAIGLNFILEDRYMIKERFFVGIKPYFNGNLNSGVVLKFGINL